MVTPMAKHSNAPVNRCRLASALCKSETPQRARVGDPESRAPLMHLQEVIQRSPDGGVNLTGQAVCCKHRREQVQAEGMDGSTWTPQDRSSWQFCTELSPHCMWTTGNTDYAMCATTHVQNCTVQPLQHQRRYSSPQPARHVLLAECGWQLGQATGPAVTAVSGYQNRVEGPCSGRQASEQRAKRNGTCQARVERALQQVRWAPAHVQGRQPRRSILPVLGAGTFCTFVNDGVKGKALELELEGIHHHVWAARDTTVEGRKLNLQAAPEVLRGPS